RRRRGGSPYSGPAARARILGPDGSRTRGGDMAPPGRTVLLRVTGMADGVCERRVRRALLLAPGVLGAEVSQPVQIAEVRYDPARTTPHLLVEAIRDAGYGAHAPFPPAPSPACACGDRCDCRGAGLTRP